MSTIVGGVWRMAMQQQQSQQQQQQIACEANKSRHLLPYAQVPVRRKNAQGACALLSSFCCCVSGGAGASTESGTSSTAAAAAAAAAARCSVTSSDSDRTVDPVLPRLTLLVLLLRTPLPGMRNFPRGVGARSCWKRSAGTGLCIAGGTMPPGIMPAGLISGRGGE